MWIHTVICSQGEPARPVQPQTAPACNVGTREPGKWLLSKSPLSSTKGQAPGNGTTPRVEGLLVDLKLKSPSLYPASKATIVMEGTA